MNAPSSSNRLRSIATRRSALALWQAHSTQKHLENLGFRSDITGTETTGDKLQTKALAEERVAGRGQEWHTGKGLFIKEVQDLIYEGSCDLAVHSLKDLPVTRSPGLQIAGFLPAAKPEDVLILSPDLQQAKQLQKFLKSGPSGLLWDVNLDFWMALDSALSENSTRRIGTTSRRRQALLRAAGLKSGDLQILRGNVDSRLKRVAAGEFAFILLAQAGLDRLGLFSPSNMIPLPIGECTPACAQGVVAIETRDEDRELTHALYHSTEQNTLLRIATERLVLKLLGGDCHSTIGIHLQERGPKQHTLHIFTAKPISEGPEEAASDWHRSATDLDESSAIGKIIYKIFINFDSFSSFTEIFETFCSHETLCQNILDLLTEKGHLCDVGL